MLAGAGRSSVAYIQGRSQLRRTSLAEGTRATSVVAGGSGFLGHEPTSSFCRSASAWWSLGGGVGEELPRTGFRAEHPF